MTVQTLIAVLAAVAFQATAQVRVVADALVDDHRARADAIAAAAVEEASRLWGVEPDAVRAELTLHRGAEGYERAEQALTGGRFRANGAFALGDEAHVLVQPPLDDHRLGLAGLPAQTLRLVAHETAHLARNTLPNHASHPDWLADATGQMVAERVMRAAGLALGRSDDPWTGTLIVRARRATQDASLPPIEAMLADAQGDLSMRDRYAARWALGAWLDEIGVLPGVLAEARRLGGGPDFAPRLRAATLDHLARTGVDDPDNTWRTWINAQPAAWEEVYRALSPDPGHPGDWLQIAYPGTNAIAWTAAAQPASRYAVSGSMEILPDDRRQMNLLLARSDGGFVSVAFTGDWGVTVFHFHAPDNRWNRLASAEAEVPVGEPVPFMVRVDGRTLSVELGDRPVLTAESPVPLTGAWGLGAQSGSAGYWRGVALRPADNPNAE